MPPDPLKLQATDFFYFNQVQEYRGKIYTLGRDSIFAINRDFSSIEQIDDGDFEGEEY